MGRMVSGNARFGISPTRGWGWVPGKGGFPVPVWGGGDAIRQFLPSMCRRRYVPWITLGGMSPRIKIATMCLQGGRGEVGTQPATDGQRGKPRTRVPAGGEGSLGERAPSQTTALGEGK